MKETKKRIVIPLLIILVGLIGALISTTIFSPLDENEWEYCESVARDIYYQKVEKDMAMIEVPNDISFRTSFAEIEIWKACRFGRVVARVKNGNIVPEREYEIFIYNFFIVLIGMAIALGGLLAYVICVRH